MVAENSVGESGPLHYQWFENEQLVGFIEYYLFDKVVIVTHTEIDSAMEGKGLGSQLASHALQFFSGQAKQIVPICGFFAKYLRKNPQFACLVTPESRKIFNIAPPVP
jgi:predicted GNAT family acetyltransferase